MTLGVIYLHPTEKVLDKVIDTLNDSLMHLCSKTSIFYILDDFNINVSLQNR